LHAGAFPIDANGRGRIALLDAPNGEEEALRLEIVADAMEMIDDRRQRLRVMARERHAGAIRIWTEPFAKPDTRLHELLLDELDRACGGVRIRGGDREVTFAEG